MNKLPPNSIKILNYLSKKYTNDPEGWVANWQVESSTMISRSNISKYTLLLVNEGLIERKYEQLGRSREVYFRFTNSKYIVKNEENSDYEKMKNDFRLKEEQLGTAAARIEIITKEIIKYKLEFNFLIKLITDGKLRTFELTSSDDKKLEGINYW